MKKLLFVKKSNGSHWVGDGFPVRSIFTYNDIAKDISPFLLMDYAGPVQFEASEHIRGVGEHPHRGFETVSIVYDGEVEHRDSSGAGGKIGPGDVQWMTAASGLIHEEMHGKDFSRTGGPFEMIQLWVNLPAKDKMAKPGYQGIVTADIPWVEIPGGSVRVIAGQFQNHRGPAKTFTPMDVWDVRLDAGNTSEFRLPKGHTSLVFVLNGKIKLADGQVISDAELAVLDPEEEIFSVHATDDTKFLVLGGEPINEPIVGYGPFVMNSTEEIKKAFADFNSGAFRN